MGLDVIRHPLLSATRHGFFSRVGGASSGIFEGLNCGRGSSDQSDIVTINRGRVAHTMGVDPSHLQSVHQYHSAEVVHVTSPIDPVPKADAMVTSTPGMVLGILTADCQPVLFSDPQAKIVGAAHAGWKGAKGGVIDATVQAMEALGADKANIVAVIGPCIGPSAYEVGSEFKDQFLADDPDNTRFFSPGLGDKHMFNLPAFGLHALEQAGITQTTWTGHCTYNDPARFFSYRRSTHQKDPDYGRLISCIRV